MQILIHILAVVAVLKVSGCWSIGGASVVAVIASKELCSSALDTEVTAGRARGGEGGVLNAVWTAKKIRTPLMAGRMLSYRRARSEYLHLATGGCNGRTIKPPCSCAGTAAVARCGADMSTWGFIRYAVFQALVRLRSAGVGRSAPLPPPVYTGLGWPAHGRTAKHSAHPASQSLVMDASSICTST